MRKTITPPIESSLHTGIFPDTEGDLHKQQLKLLFDLAQLMNTTTNLAQALNKALSLMADQLHM
ncbi:MAG: hypothetical protein PHI96_10540, partial [Desulfovibrio sp.]|nr:hypothetical protein [Desulfovibrio sp.]